MVRFLGGYTFLIGTPMRKPTTLGSFFKGTSLAVLPIVANAAFRSGLDGMARGTVTILVFRGLTFF